MVHIFLEVPPPPLELVYKFVKERKGKHKQQGAEVGENEPDFKLWDELRETKSKVKEVKEVLELVVKEEGQE